MCTMSTSSTSSSSVVCRGGSASKDYRIVSFNVNGLRSIVEHYKVTRNWSIDQWLDSFDADIICFQETKINDVSRITPALANPHRYHAYYAFHQKNHLLESSKGGIGYAGVVTYVRKTSSIAIGPVAYEEGFTGMFCDGTAAMKIGNRESLLRQEGDNLTSQTYSIQELQQFDAEGRVIITDHRDFIVINVYCPNNSGGETRQQFRTNFYIALWKRYYEIVRSVPNGKAVILVGDINIAYHPRDHADYASSYAELCRRYGGESEIERRIQDYAKSHRHDEVVVRPMEEVINSHQQVMAKVLIPSDETNSTNTSSTKSDPIDRCIRLFFEDSPMRLWLYRELHHMNDSDISNNSSCGSRGHPYHFKDSFRIFSPTTLQCYTCWDIQSSARSINYGSRIDMLFIAASTEYGIAGNENERRDDNNNKFFMTVLGSRILTDIMGSDHCPVVLDIRIHNPTIGDCQNVVVPRNTKSFVNQSKISSFFITKKVTNEPVPITPSESVVNEKKRQEPSTVSVEDENSGKLMGSNPAKKRNLSDFFKSKS